MTGRWMAGELDSNALDWSDEAAARRAVASRSGELSKAAVSAVPTSSGGQAGPLPAVGAGGPFSYPVEGPNWTVLTAMAAALAAVGAVCYVVLGTSFLWPKLKLESTPPGALVIVDQNRMVGQTPVGPVRVEPGRRHTIEFRLDGYRRELREIKAGISRGRTYVVRVGLNRLPPRLHMAVGGTVYMNQTRMGEGLIVELTDLPEKGPVKVRVEAPGYETYEMVFEQPEDIPASFDVPLKKL